MLASPIVLRRPPADRAGEPGRPVRRRRDRPAAGAEHPRPDRRGEGRDARHRPARARDPRAHRGADAEQLMALHGTDRGCDERPARRYARRRLRRGGPRPAPGGDVFDARAGRRGDGALVDGESIAGPRGRGPPRRHARGRPRPRARQALPGHRFFFAPDEVEPMPGPRRACSWPASATSSSATTASASRSPRRSRGASCPPGVDVVDFGIRGMDLVYALGEGYDAARSSSTRCRAARRRDAVRDRARARRGRRPVMLDAHGMDPVEVLALARTLGGPLPARILVVGCEPRHADDRRRGRGWSAS